MSICMYRKKQGHQKETKEKQQQGYKENTPPLSPPLFITETGVPGMVGL
jgi:hypothetical protein